MDHRLSPVKFLTLSVFSLLLFTACASLWSGSNLVVQSEPSGADVFAKVEGRKDREKIGTTPLEISETQLLEKLKLTPDSVDWVQLSFEKKEFQERTVLLPSNRWGEKEKILKIHLAPSTDQTSIAKTMIAHFFNAKKFAEIGQFDQAHVEIDKVLEVDSKSVQALNMKAGIYFLQAKFDDAKRLYKEAITIDPTASDSIKMLEKIQNGAGAK